MAVTVKRIALWRVEVENKPGILAKVLEPLATAGADLQVVMGYRYPGNESKAAVEVFPLTGKKSLAAAGAAGLASSSIPTLKVEGDNKPGLGHGITQALADAGINLGFLVAQVVGSRYSAIIGFESEAEAAKAVGLIKKATASKRK
jgi:hypothetical protein